MPNNEAGWTIVHQERAALARDLRQLTPEQWVAPTACSEWDVHDVVAHLIDTAKTTKLSFAGDMLRARGDFHRANTFGIRRERRADPAQTLAALEDVIGRTSGPPAPFASRLVEAFVHGEDIRRAVGLVGSYPVESVIEALDYQARASAGTGGGRDLVKGLKLVATDSTYTLGDGPEVSGPALSLLLATTGRPVSDLEGAGASTLLQRITDASSTVG